MNFNEVFTLLIIIRTFLNIYVYVSVTRLNTRRSTRALSILNNVPRLETGRTRQSRSVYFTKFEADRSFRSKVIRGPKFRPAANPLPGGAGPPKFNQLETVTTCIDRPSLVKIDSNNYKLGHVTPATLT